MRTILFFTEARDAEEERPPDTMTTTTKNKPAAYLALAFECRRVYGPGVGTDKLIKRLQRAAASKGAPVTVTDREEWGSFITRPGAYARFVASTQPAAPALSLMERMARAAEATRPAGCKTLALG